MEYVIASILAVILGQVSNHLIRVLPPILESNDAPKKLLGALKQKMKIDYLCTIILLICFNAIVYFALPMSYIYMFMAFCLLVVFVVDYKYQLIPDTVQILLFILGIIVAILDKAHILSHIIGMLIGGGTFFLIGVIGKLIYKKESMGFGDVKLMAALGLIFGIKNILVITVLSFFIAAIVSILLILCKIKKMDSYIPFGPFIVIATLGVLFLGTDLFINTYISICSGIGTGFTDLLFKIIK